METLRRIRRSPYPIIAGYGVVMAAIGFLVLDAMSSASCRDHADAGDR